MKCGRSGFFLLVLAVALAFSPCYAQSPRLSDLPLFEDSREYQVPGTLLNQWMRDSQKQDANLQAALLQVKTSQESFKKYRESIAKEEIIIAVMLFFAGALAGMLGMASALK